MFIMRDLQSPVDRPDRACRASFAFTKLLRLIMAILLIPRIVISITRTFNQGIVFGSSLIFLGVVKLIFLE